MTDTLTSTRPTEIIEGFWDAMRRSDLAALDALLEDSVRWENVGLPTVRGRAAVMRALSALRLPGPASTSRSIG
ncbi:snoaL-like domain protein [Mycobacteroides abscessus subsp. bolletii 1513]|uniref:SnoaL-like domain protein n=2 Tax=Mycobacteroides abscessus TaxID=36809 RepID=A0A829MHE2_9MYCO|nr:snoaL-like domain protein [Mycobacteroides abscessus MAB_091912_2446]EUA71538.1 snoaL-like domain protein [Mycobacteroides abscessus subsp. bolletii 1513]